MRVSVRVLIAAALALGASACGAMVFEHRVDVSVRDGSGHLLDRPVEVSIFDTTMGSSDEWARKTAGPSTAAAAYVGRVTEVATRTIFDRSLPASISAGLAIPEYSTVGYFALRLEPQPGAEQTIELPFFLYNPDVRPDAPVPPLPARVSATAMDKGWLIRLAVTLPAAVAAP